MSPFTPSSALLTIGPGAIALLGAKEAVSAARFADFELDDPLSLRSALQSLLETARSLSVDVVLDDELVKLFVVEPPAGLARFSDLEATSGVRFEELFGFDASEWLISADWHARRSFMASAAPRWLLSALLGTDAKVSRIEPAFVRSYNSLTSPEPLQWLACRYPDWVTAASFDGVTCRIVRSGTLSDDAPVIPWLEREALLANLRLRQVILMSAAAADQDSPRGDDVRLIKPPRHMGLLSALRSSTEVSA